MQSTDADSKHFKGLADEESINFRPSPNFKHMKKYLKSKFEEDMNSANSCGASETYTLSNIDQQEKMIQQPSVAQSAMVQPPLPPNPPPPDSPPSLNLKQEIEDDEYTNSNPEESSDANQSEALATENNNQSEVIVDKPKKTMCRNFVRGTCTRGAACIYAHELDLSQLHGVYRFCRNFQNRVCKLPSCKFVHATVFEKECFYRTGYLPPHTLSHLKEGNVLQNSPPPLQHPGEAQADGALFSNPPPPQIHAGIAPLPVNCAPTTNIDSRSVSGIFRGALPSSTSPLKREWSDIDEFSSSPRDAEATEPPAKKCKHCDSNELRLQYNKSKVEKLMSSSEEISKKMAHLVKKNNKLNSVLLLLFKPLNKGSSGNNLLSSINGDKEKAVMEQFTNFLSTNNRLSLLNEDSNKNLLNVNMNVSNLAKLLLGSGELNLSPDAS